MHIQHSERFSFLFSKMFMMHFMRPPDSSYIDIIGTGKPFKSLMNDHIMHHKISNAISHDAKTNCLQPIHFIIGSKQNAKKTGNCKNQKKASFFSKNPGPFLMMIFVQVPEKSMHNISMGKPGNAFHQQKSCQNNPIYANQFMNYHLNKLNQAISCFINSIFSLTHFSIFGKAI